MAGFLSFINFLFLMFSQEEVDHLCQLFSCYLNTNDHIRKNAENEVNQLQSTNIIGFLINCAAIIQNENNAKSQIFFAIQGIIRSFYPNPDITVDQISDKWLGVNLEIRNYLKSSLLKALQYPEKEITNIASTAICYLFNVEKVNIFPFIDEILLMAEDTHNFPENVNLAALDVINEVSGPQYLGLHNNYDAVIEMLKKINSKIYELFISAQEKSILYQENVAVTLNTLILTASPLYENQNVVNSFLPLLDLYFNRETTSDRLYELVFQMLYKITTINYNNEFFDFSPIIGISSQQIQANISKGNKDKLSISINFWDHIAKYELMIKKEADKYEAIRIYLTKGASRPILTRCPNIKFDDPPSLKSLSSIAATQISPTLLRILTMVNPNELSPEDITNKEPHMFATCCLINLFKLNPRIIYENVKNFWIQNYSPTIPWTHQHAFLLTIALVCNEPVSDEVVSFLTTEMTPGFRIFYDFLLQMIKSDILRIVDTALYAIKNCIMYYGIGLDNETLKIIIDILLALSDSNDSFIFARIMYVLSAIFKKTHSLRISIRSYLNQIWIIILKGIERVDKKDWSIDFYILSLKVIESMIKNSNDDSFNFINDVMKMIIQNLKESVNSIDQNICIIQQHQLDVIKVFYHRFYFKQELIQSSDEIIETIFSVMGAKQISVYDEALRSLIVIIVSLNKSSAALVDRILPIIPLSLSSESPSIITNTTYALATLYKETLNPETTDSSQALIHTLPHSVELIMNCLNNTMFTRDFYPTLLMSLAIIIKAAGMHIPIAKIEQMIQLYSDYFNKPINPLNQFDVEYGNELYAAGFSGFASILIALDYHKAENYRSNKAFARIFIGTPPKKLLDLKTFSKDSLMYFCDFLVAFGNFFGNTGNVLLNRLYNYKILIYACTYEDEEVQKKGDETLRQITIY
ncbi:hypothetical protein TRFO_20407 [Tritrichomonas foetus]|uniref:Importin N-terminal domain-containing protein n=1 Tax=Tritrichomonas foetus TaxID=1144522 RepID=A0A1J4KG17_9EUKA|nr:hypothetical protein TRFO_20407 [Tritrichomonas foetus]|eukprot:OHT10361.1 hypothetical protein TRFO_20407 [Tritrichomonas foetus]